LVPILACAAVRDLWAPDEPRYAMIAKWIYLHDEFLVLRRCGTLYPDKPPLVYWLAGLAGSLTGWSELAMRLVSVAAIAVVAWMTSRLARQWFGELEEHWAPVLFLGFTLIFWNSARLALDPLLTLGCVGALYCSSQVAADVRSARNWTLLAGLLGGVGMLAKGPPALVNIGLPLLAWAWQRQRVGGARAPLWALLCAIALVVLPVATWAVLASLREPALWKPLFFGQHMGRAIEGTAHHGPPWQHLLQLPAFLLPWSVPVALGVVAGARAWWSARRGRQHDVGLTRAFLWFAALFLFYSITPAKRELYLMSAYPALALLGARVVADALRSNTLGRAMVFVPAGLFGLLALLFAAAVPIAHAIAESSPAQAEKLAGFAQVEAQTPTLLAHALAVSAIFAVGMVLMLRAHRRNNSQQWANVVALTWCIGLTATSALILPAINAIKGDRAVAALLRDQPEKPSAVPCYGTAPEGPRFYEGGPCVGGVPASEGVPGDLLEHIEREGPQFLALFEERDLERLRPELRARLELRGNVLAGSRRVFVVALAR
jgi:4-amino-4-deoxy-L-arabinose transferase-like glycosyltransferase